MPIFMWMKILILHVQAHAAIEQQVRQDEIYDLRFGLRVA